MKRRRSKITDLKVANQVHGQVHHGPVRDQPLDLVVVPVLQVLAVGRQVDLEVALKVFLQVGHHIPTPVGPDRVHDHRQYPAQLLPNTDRHLEGRTQEEHTPAPGPGNW